MKFESVGLGQFDIFNLAVGISLFARYEVALSKHFRACDFGEGRGTDLSHDIRHFLHSVKSAESDGACFFDIVAELIVNVLQHVVDALAYGVEITYHFGKHHACDDCVFISCVCAYERAVTLLETEEIGVLAALLPFLDFFTNEFEAREHVEGRNAVTRCKGARKFGGDDGFDESAV